MDSNSTPTNPADDSDFDLSLDSVFAQRSPSMPVTRLEKPAQEKAKDGNFEPPKKKSVKFERKSLVSNIPCRHFLNTPQVNTPLTQAHLGATTARNRAESSAPESNFGIKKDDKLMPELTRNRALEVLEHTIPNISEDTIDPHKINRALKFLAVCALAACLGWTLYNFLKFSTQKPVVGSAAPDQLAEQRLAENAFRGFLDARTKEEKLSFVLSPDRVQPKLNEYYERPNSTDAKVRVTGPAESGRIGDQPWFTFNLEESGSDRRLTAKMRATKEGYKLDWEDYVGLGSIPWSTFCLERPKEATLMRVILAPSAAFSGIYQDESKWKAFRVSHKSGSPDLIGYVDASSRAAQDIAQLLEKSQGTIGVNAYLIFENEATENQVKILDLVNDSQRF